MFTLIIGLALGGLVLLIVELLIPGGIVGILGGLMMAASIVLCYTEYGAQKGTLLLIVLGLASIILFFVWLSIFPKSPAGRWLTLKSSVQADSLPPKPSVLPGARGRTITALRPTGIVEVEQERYEAFCDSALLNPGVDVRVIRAEGSRLVVVPLEKEA
ncbi:MAG: NfeD family protein [Verrucomicrobiia bacterium]